MKSFVFILLSFSFCIAVSAQKHDSWWLMGYGYNISPEDSVFGVSRINFNIDPPNVFSLDSGLDFDISNASICDNSGQLLFYSNGKEIYDSNDSPMEGSTDFNYHPYHNNFSLGLPVIQAILALPSPSEENLYYLFHEKVDLEFGDSTYTYSKGLYYTSIDINGNNGAGEVIEKGITIMEDTLPRGGISAIRHANGRDWWILVQERNTNYYYRVLLDNEGVHLLESQSLNSFTLSGFGQTCYSPNGKWYIKNNMFGTGEDDDYLDIYHFNRCTGLLSNHLRFPYGSNASAGGGIAISLNNRFLYVGHREHVYQYDLESNDIEASKDTIAIYDGFLEEGVFATTFFLGQLAPDGKIYFNATNSTSSLHTIHNPNGQGNNCRFEQRGMDLPTYNAFSLPNFPNYRLGPVDGSPCDTLGIDNLPLAAFNYYADSSDYLTIHFWDYSFYEPTEWEWSFGDNGQATGQTPVHTYPEPGIYEVCLTASNAYGSDSICKWLEFSPVGVKEILPEGGQVLVYPNPAKEEVILQFQETLSSAAVFNLYNALGQRVAQQSIAEGSGKSSIPVSDIIPGIYFYSVGSKGVIMDSGKLVVEH